MDATTVPPSSTMQLPVAAIICIAIGAYIVVVVILLIIRQCLVKRGVCAQFNCCGKEGEPGCCECWIAFAESLNCCKNPNVDGCLDACCPSRRKMGCADLIMCQCCANDCCGGNEPLCDCGNCACNCQCQPPECETVNCFCCQLGLKSAPVDDD